jgi:hypothetical protein
MTAPLSCLAWIVNPSRIRDRRYKRESTHVTNSLAPTERRNTFIRRGNYPTALPNSQ